MRSNFPEVNIFTGVSFRCVSRGGYFLQLCAIRFEPPSALVKVSLAEKNSMSKTTWLISLIK